MLCSLKYIPYLRRKVLISKATCEKLYSGITNSREIIKKNQMSKETCEGIGLSEVVDRLNGFADLSLAGSWDNVGLLIEPYTSKPIRNVLLTNDLTENVMQESINKSIDLIISYHPPIFNPLKRITKRSWKERIVAACLENRIAVYSPHTSWDAVYGGVTDWLAGAFGEYIQQNGKKPLEPSVSKNDIYQVTLIGSSGTLNSICKDADFIHISKYELDGNDICTVYCSKDTLQKLREIDGVTVGIVECKKNEKFTGHGRMLQVSGLDIANCVKLIKEKTGLSYVRLALAKDKTNDSEVTTIALVPGSGGSLLKKVKADLFVTGEMFHHDVLDANHNGTSVILTNHSDSERGFLSLIKPLLDKTFENNVQISISSSDSDPLKTV